MIANLPEHLRVRSEYILVPGLIPGPRGPKDLQSYANVIVDELLDLWENGIEVKHPLRPADAPPVKIRVKLLLSCMDYPAHSKINMQQGTAAKNGCIKCLIKVSPELLARNLTYCDIL